ncbi:altered inheritance of mitochondria protein 36, mitochondrial [[Candida] jaroonii]|uniref:Altered inheritance of mitochondria protein 36, mitochondrial n=1 Tax=[Candida] jaroonii TaxID=467808 RepID=A0ACA9Y8I1_9ASCO|nr:altered inheritance of mitochondria protein 36, mitochondrial [[Candida] jaroonii]
MFGLRLIRTNAFGTRAGTRAGTSGIRVVGLNNSIAKNNGLGIQSVRYRSTNPRKNEIKIRYLFYMFVLSSITVFFAGRQIDKKRVKNSFNSKEEMEAYEVETGIRRRSRLINNDKFKFISLPIMTEALKDKVIKENSTSNVQIVNPETLIEEEMKDTSKTYCFLLQDLKAQNKPLPKGLVTAVVKNHIISYKSDEDTLFILENYPLNTDDASKFENDVALINKVVVNKGDYEREVGNVIQYFDTVGKTEVV